MPRTSVQLWSPDTCECTIFEIITYDEATKVVASRSYGTKMVAEGIATALRGEPARTCPPRLEPVLSLVLAFPEMAKTLGLSTSEQQYVSYFQRSLQKGVNPAPQPEPKTCTAHAAITDHGKRYDVVLEENRRKNQVFALLQQTVSTFDENDFMFSFEGRASALEVRTLVVESSSVLEGTAEHTVLLKKLPLTVRLVPRA